MVTMQQLILLLTSLTICGTRLPSVEQNHRINPSENLLTDATKSDNLNDELKSASDCCIYNPILYIFQCLNCYPKLTVIPNNIPEQAVLVDLCGNAIDDIPGGAFANLHHLVGLSICNNSVSAIHPEAFAGLHNLTAIDIEGNHLTEIPKNFPESVKRLGLRANRFQEISAEELGHMRFLEFLSLSAGTFKPVAFRDLIFLRETHFSPCHIEPSAFNGMSREVEHAELLIEGNCDAEGTSLTLDSQAFGSYQRQRIHIRNVHLPEIPWRTFVSLPRVHEISLTAIRGLENFLPGAFYNVSEVATFTLEGMAQLATHITIHNGVFEGLFGLSTLILTRLGTLDEVEPHVFDHLETLRILSLSENRLTTLDSKVLEGVIHRLESLNVSHNLWNCDCNLRWLREYMDAHEGVFEDVDDVICNTPSHLYNKRFLDLGANDFVC